MRKLKTSLLCSLLAATVALTALSGCAAGSNVPEASAAGSKETFPIVKTEGVPQHSWQYAVSFPDWKGKPDNSLAMNSMVSFEGRHGQGNLYIAPSEGVTSFSVYINDASTRSRSLISFPPKTRRKSAYISRTLRYLTEALRRQVSRSSP